MSGRVVVVGGGVAGLTAAYRLQRAEAAPEVVLLEASDRLGGKVRSVDVGGLELEAGPDSIIARRPWAVELCRELGLGDDLVPAAANTAYRWTDRGLVRFPPGGAFGISTSYDDLLRFPGLSRKGRMRAVADLVRRASPPDGDESLGSLLRRRLGDEVTDLVVGPLLAGLHAGDVDRLSVRATFPELAAWERDFGSLIRGARAAAGAATAGAGPMFVRVRGGLARLTDALAAALGRDRIRTGSRVTRIAARDGTGFVVETGGESLDADAVVLASPAFEAARLVHGLAPASTAALDAIPYVSTAVALLVYPEGSGERLPDASGFVVPRGKAAMTAATFVSSKWPEGRFGRRAVVRCFVGAAGLEGVLEASDEEIVEGVARQLAAVVALPDRPEVSCLVRWERAMPQYEVGHLDRVSAAARALPPGIFLAGSAYGGVGIPDCVRGAGETAAGVLDHLAGRRRRETVA